jgi:hypothetical protein
LRGRELSSSFAIDSQSWHFEVAGSIMDDKTWERYGALGGVWFVVMAIIGGIFAGSAPARTDSAADIAKYYTDHDSGLQVGGFLGAIGAIGLVWWFGTLWRSMADAEEGTPRVSIIALVGFVVSGLGALTAFTVDAGTAAAIDIAGETSKIFFQISNISFGISAIGDVIMTAAVGGLILRTGFLPKWVGYLSYVVAVLALVGSVGIANDATIFNVFTFVGAGAWGVWIVVIAILNYRKTATA